MTTNQNIYLLPEHVNDRLDFLKVLNNASQEGQLFDTLIGHFKECSKPKLALSTKHLKEDVLEATDRLYFPEHYPSFLQYNRPVDTAPVFNYKPLTTANLTILFTLEAEAGNQQLKNRINLLIDQLPNPASNPPIRIGPKTVGRD